MLDYAFSRKLSHYIFKNQYCRREKINYQLKIDRELMCDCPVQLICREQISEINLWMPLSIHFKLMEK